MKCRKVSAECCRQGNWSRRGLSNLPTWLVKKQRKLEEGMKVSDDDPPDIWKENSKLCRYQNMCIWVLHLVRSFLVDRLCFKKWFTLTAFHTATTIPGIICCKLLRLPTHRIKGFIINVNLLALFYALLAIKYWLLHLPSCI
jgi:hypothetical protein